MSMVHSGVAADSAGILALGFSNALITWSAF